MEGAKINTISRETIPLCDNAFWEKLWSRCTITEVLIKLVRMTTSVAYMKLKKIIGIDANKTKYNFLAHNEIETCKHDCKFSTFNICNCSFCV